MPTYARQLERPPTASGVVYLHSVHAVMFCANPPAKRPLIARKRPREGVEVLSLRSIDGANSRIVAPLRDVASLHLQDHHSLFFERDDVGFKPRGLPVCRNEFNVLVMEVSHGDPLSPSSDSPSFYSVT